MSIYLNEDYEIDVGEQPEDNFIYYISEENNFREVYLPLVKNIILFKDFMYFPMGISINYERVRKTIWVLIPLIWRR